MFVKQLWKHGHYSIQSTDIMINTSQKKWMIKSYIFKSLLPKQSNKNNEAAKENIFIDPDPRTPSSFNYISSFKANAT